MVKIPVEVKCLGEMCKGCKQMDIDMEGVHFLPDGIRGLPMFDPHCKHMGICKNALELKIIHCKDCRYWQDKREQDKFITVNHTTMPCTEIATSPDFYCGFGVLKDGEQ